MKRDANEEKQKSSRTEIHKNPGAAGIIKVVEGLPKLLRVFREGLA